MKGKPKPRFIGSYEIVERIGPITYCLALALSFENVRNVSHVSQIEKYVYDSKHMIHKNNIVISQYLSYEGRSKSILDREVQVLRTKSIPIVRDL